VVKSSPSGIDIQRALLRELKSCSPYLKKEAFKFDVALYIPKGGEFIVDDPKDFHCWHKFRRIYCKKKWGEVYGEYVIPEDERNERLVELKKTKPHAWGIEIPQFRYKGKEYLREEDFWKSNAKKDLAICNQPDCIWIDDIVKSNNLMKEFGFKDDMSGLHLFEVKSDLDDHSRLVYQIPNMMSIADFVWLVIGENQTVPDWLPPYVGVLRHNSKTDKFSIERLHKIKLFNGLMYRHCFDDIGLRMNNDEVYAFARLNRLWKINSMFRFMFEGQKVVDMEDEVKVLLKFLKRAEKAINKGKFGDYQKDLFDFKGDEISDADEQSAKEKFKERGQ